MKLGAKLVLSFGCLIAVILVSSAITIRNVGEMNGKVREIDEAWLPSVIAIQSMNVRLNSLRADLASIMSQNYAEEIRKYEKNLQDSMDSIQRDHAAYMQLRSATPGMETPEGKELMGRIADLSAQESTAREGIIKGVLDGRRGVANVAYDKKYRPVFQQLGDTYGQVVHINVTGSKAAAQSAADAGQKTSNMSIAVTLAAVIISICITWALTRSVGRQLGKDPGELAVIARRVASGDYDIDDGGPKTGVYADMVSMAQTLKENMAKTRQESENARQSAKRAEEALRKAEQAGVEAQDRTTAMRAAAASLQDVAQVVNAATTRLAAQIEQSDKSSQHTTDKLAEAGAAMQQMNATVQDVARNASVASQASTDTRAKAENGAKIVKRSLHSIDEVHAVSLELKADMAQLHEQTQNINRIMGVISDIADQTNLLALNAAIEAARAGEAGRGFAVVADEVRKLAEKTMASTHDVANAIEAIQSSATQSMESVDRAARQIEEANTYANQSGAALADIVTTVESTADQVNAIATASEQQSAASDQVASVIAQIHDMSRQTASAMRAAAEAVEDLTAQANDLSGLITQMRAH
ncbi:methyl-accepting chemotaxis protein [Desulfovibrio desulfuricans]|uniref:Methyl-accepting chemotaxis protein n=1 Tax=Desulfovibrio desulfuricans TaxID=876 RepID=A0A4P7UN40_DESDE|nr:methyl-accepting chemotaxis protein [Desulfovibrio desulfuricans]QCC84962.1 methyl-accepting chemotaxis protein [Desulfovibrio desulfuricans]